MSRIHQLYRTYRWAEGPVPAQQGNERALAGGYSVRASSLQGEGLRGGCALAEPDLYYQLPRDVPAEARARLDPAKAPQRMVFAPSEDGNDVLALVSYRRVEGAGNPDSSFAHVLINDPHDPGTAGTVVAVGAQPAWWSNTACLELWGAPRWVREDSPEIPAELESLADLTDLLGGRSPLINRDLVLKFLTAPAGADWGTAAAVVPRRWQKMRPQQRCELFTITLRGFLAAGGQLLLVVEPSVAALWYYGILRLLPNIPLFAGMGFSTYEPQVGSLRAPLAATWFAHPATTDLAKRLYSAPRFAMNTLRKRCSRAFAGDGFYAQFVVDRLLRYGWPAIDRFLIRLQVGGAKTLADLEAMTTHLAGVQSL